MLSEKHRKRSFLRFNVDIDLNRLLKEYHAIPEDAWSTTYWGNVHCSVGMLLLRGGQNGNENDFFCDEVVDHDVLLLMPYLKELISNYGPFGESKYCFIFRTIPNGVTLGHKDLREEWFDMFRIHIPLITNKGAFVIADEKSMHFEKGYAWSFDNQSLHGVVNGSKERVHIIFDVPFNPKLAECIDKADVLEGRYHKDHVAKIHETKRSISSYPGDDKIKQIILQLRSYKLTNQQIADYLNSKGIPTRAYREKWNESAVASLFPAVFM